ncbi:MAG: DUF3418 domain-containing protein, partial [Pseudomonadales bacterium]
INESVLFTGKIFTKKDLEVEIVSYSVRQLLVLEQGLPRNAEAFEQRLNQLKKPGVLARQVERVAESVFGLHQRYHQLNKAFKQNQMLQNITVISDMQSQLQHLIFKGYLNYISCSKFDRYTIYMQGIEKRLEKYQRELPRQRLLSEQLQKMQGKCFERMDQCLKSSTWQVAVEEYRWSVEEYRLSLFAQPIKTLEVVSEKRMAQKWRELTK